MPYKYLSRWTKVIKKKKRKYSSMTPLVSFFTKKSPENLIILTRKTKSGATSQNHFIFTSNNPHPKSMAASILLHDDLRLQDVDYLDDDLAIWLEFRERFLNKILSSQGNLICAYCGKSNLEIGGRTPREMELNNKNPNLATINHITPLVDGGNKYDEKNLCVACKKCNGKKGSKPVQLFLANKKI